MNPLILALDLGTSTGWCLGRGGTIVASGTQSFQPRRFDGGGMRYLRFRRWLDELIVGPDPIAEVVFEEVRRHLGVDAAHAYGGFMATLTTACEEYKLAYRAEPVATIKKFATGRHNASKDDMLAAARRWIPRVEIIDDNHADAVALCALAMGAPAWPPLTPATKETPCNSTSRPKTSTTSSRRRSCKPASVKP